MKKSRNLKKVAHQVFELCLTDQWRPTTRDMRKRFKLTESQVKVVKGYVRAIAVSLHTGWDWDPQEQYFRVVPNNAPHIAKRMGQYRVEHARDSLKSADYLFKGMHLQGYYPKRTSRAVTRLNDHSQREWDLIEQDVI